jgi:hypothetical protein
MGPRCVSLPLNKAGTGVDVRTVGAIVLMRTEGVASGRAAGVACPIEQRYSLSVRKVLSTAFIEIACESHP